MAKLGLAPQFHWRLHAEAPAERERLCRELKLHPIVAQTLVNRKLGDPAAARELLHPSLRSLPDPARIPDMAAALDCLERALERDETILVHGDYDVDGLCGSALLLRLFELLGARPECFLPDRVQDGYSFGERSLEAAAACSAGVVVAVDNGTTAVDFVRRLRAAGPEVVIVDHHPPGPERPPATALVNPMCAPTDGELPFRELCGTGVAYLLAWGLLRHRARDGALPEAHRRFLFDALGLVALATVADVMPLRGPNRALVCEGLRALGNSAFPGLTELIRVSKLRGEPSASDLGFRLAPRLNAAGRMGRPELALELLRCRDPRRARTLALQLDELNHERRALELREAAALAPELECQRERGERVLIAGQNEGHFGVLGIVANRFMERTGLPTLLWAECAPGIARGSARAPEGVDLAALLDQVREHLDSYGGHARAAGFRFDPDRRDVLAAALHRAARDLPAPPPPRLDIDLEVSPAELSPALVEALAGLQPCGEGNPEVRFLCTDLTVAALRPIGDGSHLELRLERNGTVVRALGWRMTERLAELEIGHRVDAVYTPTINAFRGRRAVEWTLHDLRGAD